MSVITAFASHFAQVTPKTAVVLKRVNSGKTATKVTTPISVIIKPTTPIAANKRKDFLLLASSLFFTARKTNRMDKNQLTISPAQKPSAVANIKNKVFNPSSAVGASQGKSTPSNSQNRK